MDNKVILLVEDDVRDQSLIFRALSKSKIVNEVVVARDGEAALDFLFGTGPFAGRDINATPQFILLDLKLPKMSGLEVLRRIRADERTKRVPVVVFTSSAEDEDLVNSYKLGANSFVRKPIDPEQCREAITQLGLYWLVFNQVAKILIADDHAVVRDGVKKILDRQGGTIAFGEANTIPEVLRLVREQEWDVAVMDLTIGGRSSIDALKEIKNIRPELPVLILSTHGEEEYARRAFRAGAAGYITKSSPRFELVTAVEKLMSGGKYVSPAMAEKLISDISADEKRPHEALSDREFEVLRLIASGKTVTQVAQMLSLSDRTVSTYRARILEKMGMKTNAELTHYAIQNGLVE